MQKPKISMRSFNILALILILIDIALTSYLQASYGAFPWFFASLPILVGVIAGLAYLALPHGDFNVKDYYLWQVESTASNVRIEYKNYAKKRKLVLLETVFLVIFIIFGILFAAFPIWAVMTIDGVLPTLICVPVGLGMAANFAYNLWKTPLTAFSYHFDASKMLLTVEGLTRLLNRQTITMPFDEIEKIYGLSVKAADFVNHNLIRIDIINPKRYLIINTGSLVDSVAEVRFYLERIATVLPNKIVDKVGNGKFWVNP